jgi:hypothetical protein
LTDLDIHEDDVERWRDLGFEDGERLESIGRDLGREPCPSKLTYEHFLIEDVVCTIGKKAPSAFMLGTAMRTRREKTNPRQSEHPALVRVRDQPAPIVVWAGPGRPQQARKLTEVRP